MNATIYQTRMDLERNDDGFERARDIRGSFIDFETIDADDFERLYEFVGTHEVDGTSPADLDAVYKAWQGGAAYENEARSMMVGDIIALGDELHIVASRGFERLESLEAELDAREAEAEAEMARAEAAAEAKLERQFARHVDAKGWF